MTRGHGGVPPRALLRSLLLPIARSQPDLELVDLIPFGFGSLPLRYREKRLQALAGENRLRCIHGGIVSRDKGAYTCALSCAFDFLPGAAGGI